jgi:hypothetical protein
MDQVQEKDHGSVTMPEGPVLAEIIRIARIVDHQSPEGYAAHILRIMRDSVAPGLTTAIWSEWVPGSRIARRAQEEEDQRVREARVAERTTEITALLQAAGTVGDWQRCEPLRALFSRHGYYIESNAAANAGYMARWEVTGREDIGPVVDALRVMTGPVQPTLPGTESKPVEETDEDEDELCAHDGTVRCEECGGTGCGGLGRYGDPQDCDNNCPHCDHCDSSEHACGNCGLDPECSHEWQCSECDGYVTWERDHWENA